MRRCKNEARILVCHQHRFQPLGAIFSLLALFGLAAGIYQDAWKPFFQSDPSDAIRTRLIGELEASKAAVTDTVATLTRRLDFERTLSKANSTNATMPHPPQLPDAFLRLASDGDTYQLLSKPMKERIPYFSKVVKSYSEGYKMAVRHGEVQPGTIKMMLEEYRTQDECLALELQYQKCKIDAEEHNQMFNLALRTQVLRILGKEGQDTDLPEDVRLTEPTMIFKPD